MEITRWQLCPQSGQGGARAPRAERIAAATLEDALAHPTWNMGPKVTIDSASLMNKALEDAALLAPLIIRNGELDSLGAPNHLSVLGYYTLKAASGAGQMQQRLMQGN